MDKNAVVVYTNQKDALTKEERATLYNIYKQYDEIVNDPKILDVDKGLIAEKINKEYLKKFKYV